MKLRHQLAAYSPVGPGAIADAVLASAGLRTGAPAKLRERLRARYRAPDVLLCGSGTQALQHAIETVMRGARGNGVVALPAFNCFDMASAAIGAEVNVALYDVDPETLAPDPDSFERVLAAGASAAVLACLYGVPYDWDAMAAIASRYGVPLVEDAAQGHGASWRGLPLGALGRTSIISFGRGKGWTGGNGGAVLQRDGDASEPSVVDHASPSARTAIGLAAQWALGRPSLYGLPRSIPSLALGETVYHAPQTPAAMSDASAAAALSNEAASDAEGRRREMNALRFTESLTGGIARHIRVNSGARPGYIRFPVLLPDGGRSLPPRAAELGVSPSYPTTLAELPELRERLVAIEAVFPGADRLARELVTLPVHSLLDEKEQTEIIALLRDA